MFDQPDLKARYILHATAPNSWKVLTSVKATYVKTWESFYKEGYGSEFYKKVRGEFYDTPKADLWWEFGSTVPLSTYLQNIVCGPYEKVDLPVEKRYRGIPMAIYSRKSLIEFVKQEAHNIFEFNKKGIEFYEGCFNLDYPFEKLDTIFCPEYTVGAMEYPGAVTYTERLLPKKTNTVQMVQLRGSVILHELAHMWYGNAVTMRWWDGLWLNESFADFVCYLAWANIIPKLDFETYDAWLKFMTRKGWGYKEDQEKTTHQIACRVCNTQVADNIFDGITYSKGAAQLRQLVALVGEEKFSEALTEYFQEHKFGNTDLEDLLAVFKKHLGPRASEHKAYDVDNWQAQWLEKAGLNTVQVTSWKAGGSSLELTQGVAMEEHPTLRFHRIDLGFYNSKGEVVKVEEIILNDVEKTSIEVAIPDDVVAILPNYNDYQFIKVILDKESSTFFQANFSLITEPLSKGLLLRAWFDGCRDATFKVSEFFKTISSIITLETNNQVLDLIFMYLGGSLSYLSGEKWKTAVHDLYKATRVKVTSATEPNFKLSMVEKLIGYGFHVDDVEDLKIWLDSQFDSKIVQELGQADILSVAQKWQIVYKINGSSKYSDEIKKSYVDKMTIADTQDTKKNNLLKIAALNATDEERNKLWESFQDPANPLSYIQIRAQISGFTSKFLPKEKKEIFYPKFWEMIIQKMGSLSRQVAMALWGGLFPQGENTEEIKAKVDELLLTLDNEENKGLNPFVKKSFTQKSESLVRVIKVRAFDEQ